MRITTLSIHYTVQNKFNTERIQQFDQINIEMSTIFLNSENSSVPHRLVLNLTYEIDLWKTGKRVALSDLSIHCS